MLRPSSLASGLRRLVLVVAISGLAGVLLAGIALPVTAGLGLTAREGADSFTERPGDYPEYSAAQRSTVLDANGDPLATIFEEDREDLGFDEIDPLMKNAMLAIEDSRFYERGPIDFQGTIRAALLNMESGDTQAGGSTLTQQYVKLLRIDQATTDEQVATVQASEGIEGYRRKLDELRMAINVEKDLSKDQILQNYLNLAYFGQRAYGVESAAERYFSTSARDLRSDQAALLAGLVQAPSAFDPIENPDAALERRNVVLSRMLNLGMLTQEQFDASSERPLGLDTSSEPNGCVDSYAGFYCDYVVNEIQQMEALGDSPDERWQTLRTGGLTVETTLSRKTQDAADEAISDRMSTTDTAIASTAPVDPRTGAILAIANSREYGPEGEGRTAINYAVNDGMGGGSGIQNGSTMKSFVLAAAIEDGISLGTSINSPQSINMAGQQLEICQDGNSVYTWPPDYSPQNSTGSGNFNLRTGTERSVNTFFLQLQARTGVCDPATIAEDAGLTRADGGPLTQTASFVLGANEVSPLAMSGAYGMFANRGVYCESYAVENITNADGETVYEHEENCNRIIDESSADDVNEVLQGVIDSPGATGSRMQLDDRPAAGKTGTTNDAIAVWWAGYTPQFSAAVAVADVEAPQESLNGLSYNGETIGEACGGCIPGPIWQNMIEDALDGKEVLDFESSSGSSGSDDDGDSDSGDSDSGDSDSGDSDSGSSDSGSSDSGGSDDSNGGGDSSDGDGGSDDSSDGGGETSTSGDDGDGGDDDGGDSTDDGDDGDSSDDDSEDDGDGWESQ